MIPSVLLKPRRRLPRKFNRRVSPAMRSFAKRRHKRNGLGFAAKMRTRMRRLARLGPVWSARIRRWWFPVVAGVLCIATGIALFSPLFQVRRITIQRSQGRVDVARIQQQTASLLGRRMLFLSSRDVEALVKDVVPDLRDVSISKQYPSRLFLRITVQPLIARLQLSAPAGQQASSSSASAQPAQALPTVVSQDYLTEKGLYVVASVTGSSSILPVMKVVDWEVRPAPGTSLLSEEFLTKMQDAERILQQEFGQKVTVRTVYLRAKEFHLSIAQGSLWFDGQAPLDQQIARYRIFLQSAGWKQASRYVDLRLQGRVVYR